jgi:hypothetical protein
MPHLLARPFGKPFLLGDGPPEEAVGVLRCRLLLGVVRLAEVEPTHTGPHPPYVVGEFLSSVERHGPERTTRQRRDLDLPDHLGGLHPRAAIDAERVIRPGYSDDAFRLRVVERVGLPRSSESPMCRPVFAGLSEVPCETPAITKPRPLHLPTLVSSDRRHARARSLSARTEHPASPCPRLLILDCSPPALGPSSPISPETPGDAPVSGTSPIHPFPLIEPKRSRLHIPYPDVGFDNLHLCHWRRCAFVWLRLTLHSEC